MTLDSPITVGDFDGFSWIRIKGKGSFLNSPALKLFGEQCIARERSLLVVDLAACTGMDSTFMGTLAGLAARLSTMDGGRLHIAEPGERNRRSLEDLGMDFLMDIDPPAAVWRGTIDSIRSQLHDPRPMAGSDRLQHTKHVLEAHKTLSALNEKNARTFSTVVGTLEQDLAEKERLVNGDGKN